MLKRLFTWLWCAGPCKYKILHKITVWDSHGNRDLPVAYDYVLQCETCGNIKKRRV